MILRSPVDLRQEGDQKQVAPMIDAYGNALSNQGFNVEYHLCEYYGIIGTSNDSRLIRSLVLLLRVVLYSFKTIGLGHQKLRHKVEQRYWVRFLIERDLDLILAIEPPSGLVSAALRLGKPIFEVQHGAIDSKGVWNRLILPGNFICWDEPSARAIKRLFPRIKTTLISGIPNLTEALTGPRETSTNFASPNDERPSVVLSLQWGLKDVNKYDAIELTDCFLPQYLCEFIHNYRNSYNFVFCVHPLSMQRDEYEIIYNFLKTNGLIDDNGGNRISVNNPIARELIMASLHITLYSSAVIEASSFGLASIILDPECNQGIRKDMYREYVHKGLAFYANEENFSETVKMAIGKRKRDFINIFNPESVVSEILEIVDFDR